MDMWIATLIIDAQALILAIGKPAGPVTLVYLANTFVQAVLSAGDFLSLLRTIHRMHNMNKMLSRH